MLILILRIVFPDGDTTKLPVELDSAGKPRIKDDIDEVKVLSPVSFIIFISKLRVFNSNSPSSLNYKQKYELSLLETCI